MFCLWVFIPIFCLSFLPHKELRFIFPSISACFGIMALITERLVIRFPGRMVKLTLGLLILMNFSITVFRLVASIHNYPSAHALLAVSSSWENGSDFPALIEPFALSGSVGKPQECRIHFGAYAAINGISRFIHPQSDCTVDPSQDKVDWEAVSLDIIEERKGCEQGFRFISRAPIFRQISLSRKFPFFTVDLQPGIAICVKQ